jgi:hypothetical protein
MTSSDPPLLCLPPEVTDKVTDNLEDDEDLLALASTCHPFAERYYLPAVASRLGKAYHGPDPEEADEEEDSDSPRLFCLSNTVDGELGFSPFFISSAVLSPDRTKIAVGITSPAFNELRDDAPTSSYIFVDTSDREGVARMSRWYETPCGEVGDGLFLRGDTDRAYWRDDEREKRLARAPVTRDLEVKTATVDWGKTLAGRLVPATVELLEERLDCPECGGVHKVTITENTLRQYVPSRRPSISALADSMIPADSWPELRRRSTTGGDAAIGYEVTCPRCRGYDDALESLDDLTSPFPKSLRAMFNVRRA